MAVSANKLELLQIADAVAREKSIDRSIVIAAMEDAIAKANDTEYGLSSAVFSRDIKRAMAFADRLEAGICHINGPTVNDEPQAPFGGVKSSGYGRFGGKAGIAEFTEIRWVTVEDPNQHYPF